jgi:tryptophanyl-tRNA synthetase
MEQPKGVGAVSATAANGATGRRILTGDRATGRLHIGHYLGSLRLRVQLQREYDSFIEIADVQGLTTHYEKPELVRDSVFQVCLDYLGVGLDPEVVTIFIQSMVPQIAELTVLYSLFTSVNALRHNPTIKTEAKSRGYTSLTYGFLGYPVSQAADITSVSADLVPVGEDQLPHIELTREIVRRFNSLYGPTLIEPRAVLGECPRLVGLDGASTMSKSRGNCIHLSDPADVVRARIKTAVTDPRRIRVTDPGHPEVCTVHAYHKYLGEGAIGPQALADLQGRCRAGTVGCVACKERLSDLLNALLDPIRERRASYESRPDRVREIMAAGTHRARAEAERTMEAVRAAMYLDHFAQR